MLGKINFTDLSLLLWDSVAHFLPMQGYFKGYDKAIYESVYAVGIISGCELTPVSGLTVRVAAGLVLFSNGELCTVEQQDIVLSAADPTNPRIDRMKLAFTFENNVQVTKTDDSIAQLDKVATATLSADVGTPAGSPVVPVKIAGTISVGGVTVPATATVLAAGDIGISDEIRDYAASKNLNERSFAVPVSTTGVEDVFGLVADKNQFKQVWFDYQLHRKTDDGASGKVVSGTFHCQLNPETSNWQGSDDMRGQDTEEIGVVLSVDSASGQMGWDVDATGFGGANHAGELVIIRRTIGV